MQIANSTELVLGSNSPRRKQLLGLGGLPFSIDVADIDESHIVGESPQQYVSRLALAKAKTVASRRTPGAAVIGSDTTVALDGEILAKPIDHNDAVRMLTALRDRSHKVYTGVAVVIAGSDTANVQVIETDVPMRNYSDEEIIRYIATGDPMDKAGAYGIQNKAFSPVVNMQQCYASVMGFPVCAVHAMLGQHGIQLQQGIEQRCQATLEYRCPVFTNYLSM